LARERKINSEMIDDLSAECDMFFVVASHRPPKLKWRGATMANPPPEVLNSIATVTAVIAAVSGLFVGLARLLSEIRR
jgi:hypothetical protein